MPSDNSELENLSQRVTRAVGAGPTPTPPSIDDISLSDRPTHVGPVRPTEALPPSENGRYRDPQEIGRGGMGVVWKVYDSKLERWVAIKRVLPNLENYAEVANRFVTEAKALAKLSHPNIVSIFDQGQDEGGSYIVMEYVEGANLLKLLEQQSTMPVPDAIRLVRKICEGLIEAHRAQIIHRDIKPSNILVDKNGRAKLTDFGLARAGGGSGHSLSGHVLGTEGYMAPEQYADPRQASALSDQYSLAATLYHLVTGRSPRMIHLRLVPEELQELLATALEESPAKRFSSMEAFQQALDQVARRDKPQPVAATTKPTASETSEGDSNLAKLYVELKKQAEQNMVRAWQLYEAYDDEQALTLLRSVPEDLRDVSLEQNVEERLEKGKKLEAEIGQRVRNGRTAGLRALVDQYLKLYPQRKDMISLRAQLPNSETATAKPTINTNPADVPESPKPKPVPFNTVPESINTVPKSRPGWFASIFGSSSDESKSASAIAVFDTRTTQALQQEWADYLGQPVEWTNSIGMKFRLIPPGEFLMGTPDNEAEGSSDERPQHRVRLTRPFYLGMYPVTQAEYQKLKGTNPSRFTGDVARPVEQVSWDDAREFLHALNRQESGKTYRLPTEAQWEYACRAGTTTPFWFGKELNGRQANCDGDYPYGTNTKGPYLEKTTPVGKYGANPFGIFDQHGNVLEWCQDWYDAGYYQQFARQAAVDPQGPASGSSRCLRGGSWNSLAVSCRSGYRNNDGPSGRVYVIGFRVLLELS